MSQYRRLLLIIDPGLRHAFAINHAAGLARASGASLHIAALTASLKLFSLLEADVRDKARESYLQGHRDWLAGTGVCTPLQFDTTRLVAG